MAKLPCLERICKRWNITKKEWGKKPKTLEVLNKAGGVK